MITVKPLAPIADVVVIAEPEKDMQRQLTDAGCMHLSELIYQELPFALTPEGPPGIIIKPFGKIGGLECFAEAMVHLGNSAATVVIKRFPEDGWVLVLAVQTAPITPVIAAAVGIVAVERLYRALKTLGLYTPERMRSAPASSIKQCSALKDYPDAK